jgi:hypothetical protein
MRKLSRGPNRSSSGDVLREVFEFGDVQDGTTSEIFGKSVRVEIEPDFEGVFANQSHIMIGDIVVGPVRKADPERLERLGSKEFAELFGCDHRPIL